MFDHSDDSYKAPALSSPARISELIGMVLDIERAGISCEKLTPFIEELKWSISNELTFEDGQRSFCINICDQLASDFGKPDLMVSKLQTIRLFFDDYFKRLLAKIRYCLLDEKFSKKTYI